MAAIPHRGVIMTRVELLIFMRRHQHAVEVTVAADGSPQAAVVGIAVSDDFELVFDTRRPIVLDWDGAALAQLK